MLINIILLFAFTDPLNGVVTMNKCLFYIISFNFHNDLMVSIYR